jgi:hypothetical protein
MRRVGVRCKAVEALDVLRFKGGCGVLDWDDAGDCCFSKYVSTLFSRSSCDSCFARQSFSPCTNDVTCSCSAFNYRQPIPARDNLLENVVLLNLNEVQRGGYVPVTVISVPLSPLNLI